MGKKKPKLIHFISEPTVQSQLVKLDETDSAMLRTAFCDVIAKDPGLAFPKNSDRPKFNKKANAAAVAEKKPLVKIGSSTSSKLKNELFFGINEIIRSIEKRSCLGVIVTNPLTTHLQLAVSELCREAEITCLYVNGFHELKSVLNISSLTGIAFKNSVKDDTAFCSQFFKLFSELANKSEPGRQTFEPELRVQVPIAIPEAGSTIAASQLEACHSSIKIDAQDRLTFIAPSFQQLYILKSEQKGAMRR